MVAGTAITGAMTVAQWALNAAMSANPIGLVIAIIVALVAAIVLAYKNSETFRNIVQAAWNGIQVAASFAWNNILKPALDGLLAALGWVGDNKAMWLWQNVMIPAWDAIKNAISSVWNFIRPILDNIGKGIHAVGEIAAKVGDAMRNAFNGVVDVLKTPIHAVGKLLASIPDKVLGISIPGASTIKSWGETLQYLRTGGVVNNGMAGRTRNGVLWGPGSGTDDAILGVDAYGMPTALVSNKEEWSPPRPWPTGARPWWHGSPNTRPAASRRTPPAARSVSPTDSRRPGRTSPTARRGSPSGSTPSAVSTTSSLPPTPATKRVTGTRPATRPTRAI